MNEPQKPIARVANFDDLHRVLRARCAELELTRIATDEQAKLSPGYAAKLLAPVPIKRFGLSSLGAMLSLLKLELIVVERQDA